MNLFWKIQFSSSNNQSSKICFSHIEKKKKNREGDLKKKNTLWIFFVSILKITQLWKEKLLIGSRSRGQDILSSISWFYWSYKLLSVENNNSHFSYKLRLSCLHSNISVPVIFQISSHWDNWLTLAIPMINDLTPTYQINENRVCLNIWSPNKLIGCIQTNDMDLTFLVLSCLHPGKKRLHNSLLVPSQKYPPLKFSLNNILSLHFAKVYYLELKAY